MALGGLAGGITVGVLAKRMRLERAALFLLMAAVALVPMAVVLGVPMDPLLAYGLFVGCLFVSMACATMFSIQAISFVQLETPAHLIGKVIALTMALANCAQPVGQLLYGRPVRRPARRPGARGVGHGGRGVRFGAGDVARARPRLARTARGRGGRACGRGATAPCRRQPPHSGDPAQPERHGTPSNSGTAPHPFHAPPHPCAARRTAPHPFESRHTVAPLRTPSHGPAILSPSGGLTLCQKCRLTRRHHGGYTRANTDEPPFEQATRRRMERHGRMPVRGCSGEEGLMGSTETSTVFADRANDAATGASTRRDDIVEAARELYEERGLSRTTVKDITQRVGVTRSLFYHYFSDKDAVTEAVLDDIVEDFLEALRYWNAGRERGQRRQGAHGLPAHLPQRHLRERVVPAKSGEHRELGALPAFRADRGRPGGALHRRFDRARLRAVPQRGDRARLRDVLHDDRRHDGTHQGESPNKRRRGQAHRCPDPAYRRVPGRRRARRRPRGNRCRHGTRERERQYRHGTRQHTSTGTRASGSNGTRRADERGTRPRAHSRGDRKTASEKTPRRGAAKPCLFAGSHVRRRGEHMDEKPKGQAQAAQEGSAARAEAPVLARGDAQSGVRAASAGCHGAREGSRRTGRTAGSAGAAPASEAEVAHRRGRGGRRDGGGRRGILDVARAAQLLQRHLPRAHGQLRRRLFQRRDAHGHIRTRRRSVTCLECHEAKLSEQVAEGTEPGRPRAYAVDASGDLATVGVTVRPGVLREKRLPRHGATS